MALARCARWTSCSESGGGLFFRNEDVLYLHAGMAPQFLIRAPSPSTPDSSTWRTFSQRTTRYQLLACKVSRIYIRHCTTVMRNFIFICRPDLQLTVVAGNRLERLEDEVDGGAELLLQPLHIQNPALPGLTLMQQDLRYRVGHVFSTENERLVAEEGGDSSGCIEVYESCVKSEFSLLTTRGRLLWLSTVNQTGLTCRASSRSWNTCNWRRAFRKACCHSRSTFSTAAKIL
ncbi:hypothetical protein EYF80_051504 [Liparis tanakae]|uniref:Uncharacterized protein n=1 Tax=Liparis tanakae TaxID=230148 RepID=A0A4Z2FB11_9TELE|nr:hypothetical protein EYF80_051504 [Liparis tanakae]